MDHRVVGGSVVTEGYVECKIVTKKYDMHTFYRFPYHVSLGMRLHGPPGARPYCGGTLLSLKLQ